ncbi:Nif11-like leader peptide family natural product precursor (plasmid) [Azospirillum baldaniorum]|uniref:Nif11 domain-containing protein n=1 Tax=Azospirillum baldaniorum TaxID=1064539 RepID=A0A9P1NRT6_9PROT|nr:Nif11-like leader peptide family natural product precursor [Azospirillum baldaniorum]TWA77908.1 putative ribosomally synthesized peptide with nif11-like leader [Azospirillum brasilense]AWJ93217.1 Nif11-like leader peptide family natural product precursor [Azospirillum baldaniorum]NUB09013.1 Nif11-like leader peptide family natural product precursor [Azospirillum baldaniorum]TWA56459.1 putative ribosomally synthesized peptide with nif11-like leader [Azospirillum baldaniorum]CCD02993.1 conser
MSVESAIAYITRMREDEAFRRTINDGEDEAANWAFIRAAGFDFTVPEFKQATEAIYHEHGITPL